MATETKLSGLVLNEVESKAVYDKLKEAGKVNENELWLIPDDEILKIEESAKASAAAAANSATSASTSASNAKTSETNAASSATAASKSATAASNSATTAGNSASAASTSASNASKSATAAKTSETNAASSATTATTKASEAAASAKEAKDAAASSLNANKADKKVPSTANNVALLDANGNLADSGKQLTPSGIGAAAASHTHSADNIKSGILPVERGGTGNATGYVTAGHRSGTTLGNKATAEGDYTTASGYCSHAEGSDTTASKYYSHAEGHSTTASNESGHAEGAYSTASGYASHAEGAYSTASGYASHAEGLRSTASGYASHAEGEETKATEECQHVEGRWNAEPEGIGNGVKPAMALHIVGNGTSDSARANANVVYEDGTGWFAGDVYVGGGTSGKSDTSVKLARVDHTHDASSITSGALPISHGGTGATTAEAAIAALGAAPEGLLEYTGELTQWADFWGKIKDDLIGKWGDYSVHCIRLTDANGNVWVQGGELYFWVICGTNQITYTAFGTDYGGIDGRDNVLFTVHAYVSGGAWTGYTEWAFPPMYENGEFRTLERYGRNIVYTALLNLGAMATSKQASVDCSKIIRHKGITSSGLSIPFGNYPNDNWSAISYSERNILYLRSSATFAEQTGTWYEQVWYIK